MFKNKFQKWLNQRFHFDRTKQLKQSDILVFLHKQGYLYLVLIVITFIAGINYANNLILGFCFLIGSILCISFYLTFKQLHQLQIEIIVPELGQVDQQLIIQMYLKQNEVRSRFIYIHVDKQIHRIHLKNKEQQFNLQFYPMIRGQFEIPKIQLYSMYPFGLVKAWSYFYLKKIIWIAPQAAYFQNEFQISSHSDLPNMDEFHELRSYQLGDSLQTISWKQMARGQGMYVKQFENHAELNIIQIDYAKMPSVNHEEKLSLMMGLVEQCEQQQVTYSLNINQKVLKQGLGMQQCDAAKRMLAQA